MSTVEHISGDHSGDIHTTDARPARAAAQVRLAEIPHIDDLTRILGSEIDWDMLDRYPQTHQIFEYFRAQETVGDLSQGNVHGAIMETHVHELLKRAGEPGQFPGSLSLDVLPEVGNTEHFRFVRNERGGYLFRKNQEKRGLVDYVEIDGLVVINGTPVVLEVKAGTDHAPARRSVRNERIEKIREVLGEVYPSQGFGFVLVTPQDLLVDHGQNRQNFEARGGVAVALGAPSNVIDAKIRDMATKREITFDNIVRVQRPRPKSPVLVNPKFVK